MTRRRRSRRRPRSGWRRCRTTPSSAPDSRSRCATWSCAAPGTCSATSSPGTWRRSVSSCTCRCWTRRCATPERRRARGGGGGGAARAGAPGRQRRCVRSDRLCPLRAGQDRDPPACRRGAGGRPSVQQLREELEDRFGPVPEPLENLLALQRARIKFGQAGATAVSLRGDRLAVTPIELDSRARAGACARSCPRRSTSPGARRSRCACRARARRAFRPWSGPRTCCWRSRARPLLEEGEEARDRGLGRGRGTGNAPAGGPDERLQNSDTQAQFPLKCPRRVKVLPDLLGARRRFLCRRRPGRVRRGHPRRRGRAGRRQRRSPRRRSNTGWRWRRLDASARDDRRQAGRSRPARLHGLHRAPGSDRRQTGQGSVQAHRGRS